MIAMNWMRVAILGAVLAGLALAYNHAYHSGKSAERTRWQEASAEEQARQQDALDTAQAEADADIARLLAENTALDATLQELSDAARSDPNAGQCGVGIGSVQRLNAVGDTAETPTR